MRVSILRLDKTGSPSAWIGREAAATSIAKGQVLWSLGAVASTLNGGTSRMTGERSFMDLPAIIATDGNAKVKTVPRITNRLLFARDRHTCLYCGDPFPVSALTRDHVIPQSKGGPDVWTNCVASCSRCNHRKSDRTPEQANMPLLAVPFEPNLFEWFALGNRNILADQMEYLSSRFRNVQLH